MANVLTTNPWTFDTPTTFDFCTGTFLRIKSVRWVGATTAGHAAKLADGASVTWWESLASGSNNIESDLIENQTVQPVLGFRVSALQSGRLYVTLA